MSTTNHVSIKIRQIWLKWKQNCVIRCSIYRQDHGANLLSTTKTVWKFKRNAFFAMWINSIKPMNFSLNPFWWILTLTKHSLWNSLEQITRPSCNHTSKRSIWKIQTTIYHKMNSLKVTREETKLTSYILWILRTTGISTLAWKQKLIQTSPLQRPSGRRLSGEIIEQLTLSGNCRPNLICKFQQIGKKPRKKGTRRV